MADTLCESPLLACQGRNTQVAPHMPSLHPPHTPQAASAAARLAKGIVTLVSWLFANAQSPMEVTLLGIVTLVIFLII